MAISRVTVWNAGDTLTAAAQNGEFNNIINNALALISPLTGNLNANLRQITNLLLETLAASQTAATEGRVYYQTTTDQVEVDDGTNIRRVPTIASVTRGDIIRAGATANQWERLARGTAGTFPISDGTDTVASTIRLPNSALTNGQLAIGSTGAAASAATLTAGNGITVTNGAGSVTLAVAGLPASVNVLGSRDAAGEFIQRSTTNRTFSSSTDVTITDTQTSAITFTVAFSATPTVVFSVRNNSGVRGCGMLTAVSTTAFTPGALSSVSASIDLDIHWIAVAT